MYEIPGLDVLAPVLDAYAIRSFYFLCSETIELSANPTMNERFLRIYNEAEGCFRVYSSPGVDQPRSFPLSDMPKKVSFYHNDIMIPTLTYTFPDFKS